jgi:hypothetical protein
MLTQHIAGLPIEEILLAAVATAAPLIALVIWEIRDRLRRVHRFLRRWIPEDPVSDAAPEFQ